MKNEYNAGQKYNDLRRTERKTKGDPLKEALGPDVSYSLANYFEDEEFRNKVDKVYNGLVGAKGFDCEMDEEFRSKLDKQISNLEKEYDNAIKDIDSEGWLDFNEMGECALNGLILGVKITAGVAFVEAIMGGDYSYARMLAPFYCLGLPAIGAALSAYNSYECREEVKEDKRNIDEFIEKYSNLNTTSR